MPRPSVAERFWSRVDRFDPDECWEWMGCHNNRGYSSMGAMIRGRRVGEAHRVSYELNIGPIPDGVEIDHLCRNRGCVNPKHMELVDHRTNNARGDSLSAQRGRQTHCVHGHPLSGDNLRLRTRPEGGRECRQCQNDRNRRRRSKVVV